MEWKITVWDSARIAYVSTAKVANTAVKAALLASYIEGKRWANPHAEAVPYVEATPEELQSTYADYLTFGLSRNPYDRFVSFYSDKIVGDGWYAKLRTYGFRRGMDFEACALAAAKSPDGKTDPHATSQVDRLVADGRFLPDLVLRFEEIKDDWEALRAIAGVRAPETPLAPLKARRTSTRDASWQTYYTPTAQKAVAERYAADFEVLGYSTELEPAAANGGSASKPEDLAAIRAAAADGTVVVDATGYDGGRANAVQEAGGWYLPFGAAAGTRSRGQSADRLVRKLTDGPRTVVLVAPGADRSGFGQVGDHVTFLDVTPLKRRFLAKLLGR